MRLSYSRHISPKPNLFSNLMFVNMSLSCFHCGGDHWLRDCPEKPIMSYKGKKLPLIERYCAGCCVDHLPKMCPRKPAPAPAANVRPNQALNYIEVIPSPFAEEEEKDRASLRVVTRAQAHKKMGKTDLNHSQTTDKQPRKQSPRKIRSRKGKKSKSRSDPKEEQTKPVELTG